MSSSNEMLNNKISDHIIDEKLRATIAPTRCNGSAKAANNRQDQRSKIKAQKSKVKSTGKRRGGHTRGRQRNAK